MCCLGLVVGLKEDLGEGYDSIAFDLVVKSLKTH